jgi:hypothetical protein
MRIVHLALALAAASGLGLCLLLAARGGLRADSAAPHGPAPVHTGEAAPPALAAAAGPAAARRRAADSAPGGSAPAEGAAQASSLRDRLAAVARAEGAQDAPAFDAALRAVIDAREGLAPVLDGLAEGAWEADGLAFRGAIVALVVAAARDAAAGGTAELSNALVALPGLPERARSELVGALSETQVAGRWLCGARELALVARACRAHPGLSGELCLMLAHLEDDAAGLPAVRALLLELASDASLPELAAVALRALFALDASEAELALEALRARGGLSGQARLALAEAVGRRATPERAIELLAREGGIAERLGMFALGEREEAREALRERYNQLVQAAPDGALRVALVGAMHREETEVLRGIAESDPSPLVREQALLTLTATRGVEPEVVATLRDALRGARRGDAGGDAAGGAGGGAGDGAGGGAGGAVPPRACVAAAGNVVATSRGRAREEALALLREIAVDPAIPHEDRRSALEALRKHDPQGDWSVLGETEATGPPRR